MVIKVKERKLLNHDDEPTHGRYHNSSNRKEKGTIQGFEGERDL